MAESLGLGVKFIHDCPFLDDTFLYFCKLKGKLVVAVDHSALGSEYVPIHSSHNPALNPADNLKRAEGGGLSVSGLGLQQQQQNSLL